MDDAGERSIDIQGGLLAVAWAGAGVGAAGRGIPASDEMRMAK
jgi:hypothetical protein